LNSLGESIRVDRGAQLVSMEFRKNGRSLGTATVIPSRDGDIGRDRLHDIIIDHVGPALLARPWKDAVRETRGLLQENLLEVLRG
jgi:hypothetical protein